MNSAIRYHLVKLLVGAGLWILILGWSSWTPRIALAQEPTPLPTPTSMPTPTNPPPASPTPSPTATGVIAQPTATATPDNSGDATDRLIVFRVDDDEIDKGECTRVSWVVKGDVAYVELDIKGDGKGAFLVSEEDERQVCPEDDAGYQLYVTWLNDEQSKSDTLEVGVNSGGSGDNGGGDSGGGVVATPGDFVVVTPIRIEATPTSLPPVAQPVAQVQAAPAEPASAPEAIPADAVIATPSGPLSAIRMLPQTGANPEAAASNDELASRAAPAQTTAWPYLVLVVVLAAGLVSLLRSGGRNHHDQA